MREDVALEDARKRIVVLCVTALIFLGIVYQATNLWLAWHWERSSRVSQQLKGARLSPGNAEAWERIGEEEEGNFDARPGEAIGILERAEMANPLSARAWMDLAQAYEVDGNVAEANAAYQKAQLDYPVSADVAWKYGNFLLRQGRMHDGLREIHQSLLTDSHLIPLAISRVWRSAPDVKTILNQVLPQNEQAWLYALDFFAANHDKNEALETWRDTMSLAKTTPIDIHAVFPFMQYLIATDQAAESQEIWNEAVQISHWPAAATSHSQVWNGGFEEPIANGGLGWRIEGAPGTYISIDSEVFHSGRKSLRVDFTGGFNVDFAAVHEIVPVEPNTSYKFEYFMRTQDISTDSGMRFEVLDLNDNEVNLMTPDLRGTNPWTPMQTDVETGRKTHFLDVRLRRLPSQLFDNKLSGTVWVDDVSLTPEGTANSEAHP